MPTLPNIVRALNKIIISLALLCEPLFLFFSIFCADSPVASGASIFLCFAVSAFLPLWATGPFIGGSFLLLRRGYGKTALSLSCTPLVLGLAFLGWLLTP